MNKAQRVLRYILAILVVVALVTVVIGVYSKTSEAADESIIRVKLSVGTPSSLDLSLAGNYGIKSNPDISLSSGCYSVKVSSGVLQLFYGSTLICSGTNIKIIEYAPFSGGCNLVTLKTTTYGTHNYLGDMEFRLDGSHIDVINHVYLEYYLYGVVPHEMSNSWPMEALKTQAVAARTYAARYMTGGGSYDVVDTTANQVYKGYTPSYTNAIQAVNETAKMVLKSEGELAQTFFTASNGGYVDIPQHLWSASAALKPYHVIQKDPYDTQNAWSLQEVLIFPKAISDSAQIAYLDWDDGSMVTGTGHESANAKRYFKICALPAVAAKGYMAAVTGDIEITGINSFVPHTYQGNHYVNDAGGNNICVCYTKADISMNVTATREATPQEELETGATTVTEPVTVKFTIDMHVFDDMDGLYRAFNNASLRLFVVEETDTDWRLYHRRYGHGVGMSQRGAQTRAKAGQTYEEILSFYYPNTYFESLNISPPDLGDAPEGTDATNAVICNCSSYVNVRSAPNTDHPAIGKAFFGSRITVTEPNAAPDWHRIDFGGIDAYIYAYYVKLDDVPKATPTPEPTSTPTITEEPSATAAPTAAPSPTAAPTSTPTVTAAPTPAPTPSAPEITKTGTVWVNVLNIRSGAGTSYAKIDSFAKGDSVDIVTVNYSPDWHQIWFQDQIAYVYAQYVTVSDTPAISDTGTVWANTLNIRSGPGTSYTTVGKFSKGDSVDIIKANYTDKWHQIYHNGQTAYVYAYYVKLSDTVSIETTGVITSSVLNIRSGPGTSYTKLGTFSKGDTVDIVKSNYTADWHKILYNGSTAYVHASYVSLGGTTDPDTAAVYAAVKAGALNFRQAPSLSAAIIDTLKRGDTVQVLEQGGTWYKVRYGGREGYMYAAYLERASGTFGKVTASVLNVRSGASTSTAIVGRLGRSDVVEIIETGTDWYKVRYQSSAAYVYAAYIELQ